MRLLILGGGPGGYVAAIKAAQLGAEVTLIEKEHMGGTCLNVGCIPTKVLLNTADLYDTVSRDGDALGLDLAGIKVDWERLQTRKSEVVDTLVSGVEGLMDSNGIELVRGTGRFISRREVEVVLNEGGRRIIEFDNALIATGSQTTVFPIPGIETPGVVTSNEMLSLSELPKRLVIVGGGVIGSEFASLFSRLGVKVTIVEMLPRIVVAMDEEIVRYLDEALRRHEVEIMTHSKVERFSKTSEGIKVAVTTQDGPVEILADKVLLSIGRHPVTEGLGLEEIGVRVDKGIRVDKRLRTSIPNIYAAGDCTGGVMLAHVASAQGIHAVESIMGRSSGVAFDTTPYCVYTRPELASVGMTEDQVKEKGIDYVVGRFPLMGNGKSLILGETDGMVKMISDRSTGEILGMHMAGPKATELIVEGALAIRLEATVEEIITTIHAHPTVGEALHEAAHATNGRAIHLP